MAILEISWRGISRKLGSILGIVLLNAIVVIMMGAMLFYNDSYYYDEYKSDNFFVNGNDNTYCVTAREFFDTTFLYEIDEIEYFENVSTEALYYWDGVEELEKENNRIYKEVGYETMDGLSMCEISNKESLEMFNIKFKEKLSDEELEKITESCKNERIMYLFLGSKYQGIKVGTVIENVFKNADAVIVGQFAENQEILISSSIVGSIGGMSEIFKSIDEEIFLAPQDGIYSEYYFTLKQGANFGEVKEKIEKKMQSEYGDTAIVCTVSDLFEEKGDNNAKFIGIIQGLLIIVTFSSILISSCIMILDIQKNQKMYGIMSANGFTTADIIKSILIENGVVMLLSMLGALIITYTQVGNIFENTVFVSMTSVKLALFCLLLITISTVAPAIYISKMDTKKMIEGEVL